MVQTAAHCVYSASYETAMSQATFVPGFLPNNADSEYAPHTFFALEFFLLSCLLVGTCQHSSACMFVPDASSLQCLLCRPFGRANVIGYRYGTSTCHGYDNAEDAECAPAL